MISYKTTENGKLPAYPTRVAEPAADDPSVIEIVVKPGLTKREVFAMAAMQGMLSACRGVDGHIEHQAHMAEIAVTQADELLKALES